MSMAPNRPLLRWPGGKWKLAPWVISHFPAHRVYVEPFAGAASVLLRKPRARSEVINDLDGDVVNLFRVLRNPEQTQRLARLVALTPFARAEFDLARQRTMDPIERARRLLIRSYMGQGSCVLYENNGFRSKRATSAFPAQDWANFPPVLQDVATRLRGVVIEQLDALEIIKRYDGPGTLFYLDPPYVHATRADRGTKAYRHELTDDQHGELAEALRNIKGMAVVSGYNCDLYDALYAGWQRISHNTHADRAVKRTETLWLSPCARVQGSLLEGSA